MQHVGNTADFRNYGKKMGYSGISAKVEMNQYWTYSSKEETPQKKKVEENGCYWE